MDNPFHSAAAFVSPSLNRVRVAKLPGPQYPTALRDMSGFDLLSAASLKAIIHARAADLNLQAEDPNILAAFDRCFDSPIPRVRMTARQIAEEYGRHLGLLLLTLKRADPANGLTCPAWGKRHWAFWQNITTVYAGGGLLSGSMGALTAASAQLSLAEGGYQEASVQLAPFAAHLPMAGLARKAPPNSDAMLLFDFGQSVIKRAVAICEPPKRSRLDLLAAIETGYNPSAAKGSEQELAEAGAEQLVDVVAQSWQETLGEYGKLVPIIGLSLACHLVNGHPPPSEMGYYGRLQLLTGSLQEFLAERISHAVGQKTELILAHDGSAAALAYAGCRHTAVLMLGTAIGVGFPPESGAGLQAAIAAVNRCRLS